MEQDDSKDSAGQPGSGNSPSTTFRSVVWRRAISYIGYAPGERLPRRILYEFTTLDTVKEEHRRVVSLLDATDMEQGVGGVNPSINLKDMGEKLVNADAKEVIYVIF